MRNFSPLIYLLPLCISFWQESAIAGDCIQVCNPGGSCRTDCSSQAPSVTPATSPQRATSYNSCQYAFNGLCEDDSYPNAVRSSCSSGTDESDCNPRMRRSR